MAKGTGRPRTPTRPRGTTVLRTTIEVILTKPGDLYICMTTSDDRNPDPAELVMGEGQLFTHNTLADWASAKVNAQVRAAREAHPKPKA